LTPAARKNKKETTLDEAPMWRHPGAMLADSKATFVRALTRVNLRLAAKAFEAIDECRGQWLGNITHNIWTAESIEEKLAGDRAGGLKGSVSDHA
jgi:hypothetical protein